MSKDSINMPAGFGGLMRYNEEYDSKFKFKPANVILFVILIIAFVIALNILFPVPV
jgi:preprotein translocase subunit Sec61beta